MSGTTAQHTSNGSNLDPVSASRSRIDGRTSRTEGYETGAKRVPWQLRKRSYQMSFARAQDTPEIGHEGTPSLLATGEPRI